MSDRIHAFSAMDRAGDLVPRNAAAVGVLWATALPGRLMLLLLIVHALRLHDQARSHAHALGNLAWGVLIGWLLSLYGRQVFVRACRAAQGGGGDAQGPDLWVPWRELLAGFQAAVVIEVIFWATLPGIVFAPPLLVAAGLAAVAAPLAGPGWMKPLRALDPGRATVALILVALGMMVALVLAMVNLVFLARVLLWLAGGVAGFDIAAWEPLVGLDNPLFLGLAITGATLIVEPFWLATLVAVVYDLRARRSGEDLRDWLGRLEQAPRAGAPGEAA